MQAYRTIKRGIGRWGVAFTLGGLSSLPSCSGDDGAGAACTFNADCASTGVDYVCVAGQCVPPGGGGTASDTAESGSSEDEGSTAEDTATGAVDGSGGGSGDATTGVADTGGGTGITACDPPARLFSGDPRQASISVDFGAMTCAAHSQAGDAPQLVLDIRSTGLTDIRAEGMTIQSSSLGTFVNETNVVGLTTDVPVTLAATSAAEGTAVLIFFTIDEIGPQVANVGVDFSPE